MNGTQKTEHDSHRQWKELDNFIEKSIDSGVDEWQLRHDANNKDARARGKNKFEESSFVFMREGNKLIQ